MTQQSFVLGLSEDQLHHYQRAFKLSYHLSYLQVCQQFLSFSGLDVLEVGGALPASLVINHLACNSWTSIEAPAYDEELGSANQFHRNLQDLECQLEHKSRYKHLYLDIENIPEDHFGKYDLIFSIACFEHIHRLPQALRVMHRCLKAGGHLFTMHSPIWSAFDGHHLPLELPSRFAKPQDDRCPIFRSWEHLLLNRKEALRVLTKRFDMHFAEEVLYYTYNSDHINRYFSEDYLMIFNESPFMSLKVENTFITPPSKQIQSALESANPGYQHFSNNGVLAFLKNNSEPKILYI